MDLDEEHRLSDVESMCRFHEERIKKLEISTEAINRLATSMEVLASKQNEVANTVEKLDKKVSIMENKPAKQWENLINQIIMIVAAAVIGFLLSRLGM